MAWGASTELLLPPSPPADNPPLGGPSATAASSASAPAPPGPPPIPAPPQPPGCTSISPAQGQAGPFFPPLGWARAPPRPLPLPPPVEQVCDMLYSLAILREHRHPLALTLSEQLRAAIQREAVELGTVAPTSSMWDGGGGGGGAAGPTAAEELPGRLAKHALPLAACMLAAQVCAGGVPQDACRGHAKSHAGGMQRACSTKRGAVDAFDSNWVTAQMFNCTQRRCMSMPVPTSRFSFPLYHTHPSVLQAERAVSPVAQALEVGARAVAVAAWRVKAAARKDRQEKKGRKTDGYVQDLRRACARLGLTVGGLVEMSCRGQ